MKFTAKNLQFPTFHTIKLLLVQNLLPEALKSSLLLPYPGLTDQIYANFLKSGHVLDNYLSTSLITHFSKSGVFYRSLGFLLDTEEPDAVAFNALLSGYAQFRQTSAAFALYNKLTSYGLMPNKYTLSSLIKSCDDIQGTEIAHDLCIKLGLNFSNFLVSGLVQKYAKFGRVESAEKCFRECLAVDDVVSTAMINGYVWNNEFEMAVDIFVKMNSLGMELNEFSLTSILGALWDIEDGEQVHCFGFKKGFLCGYSIHLSNAITSMYCRCGSRMAAAKMFDEITEPDVVSWTARIGAAGDGVEALELLKVLHSNNLKMNELTLINALSAVEGPELLKPGRVVHSLCHKNALLMTVPVGNALITMYGKCGQMEDASRVFNELLFRDTVSWNTLIGGYSENGLAGPALTIFSQMRRFYLQPDVYTLASVLGAASNPTFTEQVRQIHALLVKCGLLKDESMFSCLITSYGKCGGLDEAKRVFAEVEEMSASHLVVVAAVAIQTGFPADALELFNFARNNLVEMDGVAFSLVLKACGALTSLGQAMAIHSLALKFGFENDNFVESTIIDIYCKCGSIVDAVKAFRSTCKANLAAGNAMIMGYAQHGCYNEVLGLFNHMIGSGIKPDEITYLGILTSCCHAGLVDEARGHLRSMFELHGVTPCLEHYACVIDLLGRVGLIEEAKKTVDQMPVCPDAQVWQILLSACCIYGDLDIGQHAATELIRLQPQNDSAYVLLSSLYAKTGNWDIVRTLRRDMKTRMISKEPGTSWIEVGNAMFKFVAEDNCHPESERIYLNLQTLSKQMLPLLETKEDYSLVSDF